MTIEVIIALLILAGLGGFKGYKFWIQMKHETKKDQLQKRMEVMHE